MKQLTIYHDQDADVSLLTGKTVAVIGYGAQGRAQARMMHESGVQVIVGVRSNGPTAKQAHEDGLRVASIEEAVKQADIVHILIPDEHQKTVYESQIEPHLKDGAILSFSHGFNIVFGYITPKPGMGVIMVAPKCPGTEEYKCYKQGFGVPALISVYQENEAQNAKKYALAMSKAMYFTKAGVMECTFSDEAHEDLFGEQAVLCGGMAELIKAGFETLVEAGYPPEFAYFECLHEAKLIVDLMYEGGLERMWSVVSNTAEFGGQTRGPRIITPDVKARMKEVLEEVENGTFAREWMEEVQVHGMKNLLAMRQKESEHPIEIVGKKIRGLFEKESQ